jgi:hypothetical protein
MEFPEDRYEKFLIEEEERLRKEAEERKKTSEIASKTLGGLSNAGSALVSTKKTTEDQANNVTKIENKGMSMIVGLQAVNESSQEKTSFTSENGPSIVMPALSKVLSSDSRPPAISTKMLVFASNPFKSTEGNSNTKGSIVSLQLSDSDGNELKINNTDEAFVIQIPAQTPAKSFKSSVNLTGYTYFKVIQF